MFDLYACTLFIASLCIIEAIEIDNGVVGAPTIDCGSETVSVWVNTRKPFGGKIFVKGESENPQCYRAINVNSNNYTNSYSPPEKPKITPIWLGKNQPGSCPPCPVCQDDNTSGTDGHHQGPGQPSQAHIVVKTGTCSLKRIRQTSPPGMLIKFTVVVSFHQLFITKVDKAYQIQCFYMEAEKTVTSELGVSMVESTTVLTGTAAMPVCEYSIRKGRPDGPTVKYVMVGEEIYHRWECSSRGPQDLFGFLIHSCFVTDGTGQRFQIIDRLGCSPDLVLVGNIEYTGTMVAFVQSHVFKFADRSGLDFQCAIAVCVKVDGGCDGITPPKCSGNKQKRRSINYDYRSLPDNQLIRSTQDVLAPTLTVLDVDSEITAQALENLQDEPDISQATELGSEERQSQYCVSILGFGFFVAIATFIFTGGTVFLTTVYIIKRKIL